MEARIQRLIGSENLSPTKFADIIGVQRSAISHILSGRNKPSYDLMQKILSKFPRVSSEWLLMGRGEMYKTTIQQRLFDVEVKPTTSSVEAKSPINKEPATVLTEVKAPENPVKAGGIERIIIFYNDKSFKEYFPGE